MHWLFRYQGHIGAALVLGGVDITGPQLFTIAPHGSTDKLPYVTMGSGSLAAMAIFESSWRPNLEVRPPSPFIQYTLLTQRTCPLERRSPGTRHPSHLRRYLQRPRLRLERRRVCDHRVRDRDAEELCEAERAGGEGETVCV